jgi:hypothetical protein
MPPPAKFGVMQDIRAVEGLTTIPLPKKLCHVGFVVHYQDTDAHNTASPVVRWGGRRIVNSVNSPKVLSTSIVPPCCWVTMS